jgi:hypothetical protein
MAESAIEPEIAQSAQPEQPAPDTDRATPNAGEEALALEQPSAQTVVIWTPGFIVCFALTLGLGLCAECLLTRGWQAHLYGGNWVLLGHLLLLLAVWVTLVLRAGSFWIRLGAVFACLWSFFVGVNLVINLHPFNQASPVIAYLNASGNLSLLGSYLCFASASARAPRWDSWFSGLALIGSIITVTVAFTLTAPDVRSLTTIADTIAATTLLLCVLVWWLRPVCWKIHPGPTLLFGLAPTIVLILSLPGITSAFNNLFFLQVADLCLLLGGLRLLQGERVSASS